MNTKVLTQEQVEQFITRGYVKVEQAFAAAQALKAQEFLWTKVEERGVLKNDRSTWTKPMVHIAEGYVTDDFKKCLTTRLCDAVEDLVGPGRWRDYGDTTLPWGWWPVNFSLGADQPWDVPTKGWHWDGIQFKHTVDAPDQGLLLLCTFSSTKPGAGATLVAEGSHQIVARFLKNHPEGIEVATAIDQVIRAHPWLSELAGHSAPGSQSRIDHFMNETTVDDHGTRLRVVEATADAGDIYLCHPFLFHAASPNHSGQPRFMCNRTTPLKERMNLNRADADYSPVELSIRSALSI